MNKSEIMREVFALPTIAGGMRKEARLMERRAHEIDVLYARLCDEIDAGTIDFELAVQDILSISQGLGPGDSGDEAPAQPARRGRKPGSKNKPKDPSAPAEPLPSPTETRPVPNVSKPREHSTWPVEQKAVVDVLNNYEGEDPPTFALLVLGTGLPEPAVRQALIGLGDTVVAKTVKRDGDKDPVVAFRTAEQERLFGVPMEQPAWRSAAEYFATVAQ